MVDRLHRETMWTIRPIPVMGARGGGGGGGGSRNQELPQPNEQLALADEQGEPWGDTLVTFKEFVGAAHDEVGAPEDRIAVLRKKETSTLSARPADDLRRPLVLGLQTVVPTTGRRMFFSHEQAT